MSLSGSSLPCWLLLWLFAVAPVVAEAECQSFKTPELWPVMMHICCIAGIEAVCPTGQLSKRAGRVRGSSRSSLDPMFLDVPRSKAWNDATKEPTEVFIRRPQSHLSTFDGKLTPLDKT